MKKLFIVLAAMFASTLFAQPQRVIFDTDMGNDIDDAFALLMLFDYQKSGQADLAAVLVNKDHKNAPVIVDVIANYYGFRKIPLGMVKKGVTPEKSAFDYAASATNSDGSYKYARTVDGGAQLVEAYKLARKVLAESADNSVVYISVGFSTNVANLLKSQPDEISPLTGRELVAKKVKYFSVMAANFEKISDDSKRQREYNVIKDIPSARYFVAESPSPIVFSGFEIGMALRFPQSEIDKKMGKENPVRIAYELHAKMVNRQKSDRHDRPTWDLTSVSYVFNPSIWNVSEPVSVSIDENGRNYFSADKNGKHRYLEIPQNGKQKIIDDLVKRSLSLKPVCE